MATRFEEPKGSGLWVVQYVDGDKRPKIRLGYLGTGKAGKNKADAFKTRIEDLLAARRTGHTPGEVTLEWLNGLDDATLSRLAELGLVAVQKNLALGEWLERYIDEQEGNQKPASIVKLRQTKAKLLDFFGASTQLRALTIEGAANWWNRLTTSGLALGTRKTHAGNAKTFMNEARERGHLDKSPFDGLESGPTARLDAAYVSLKDTEAILSACSMFEAKLAFALVRLAGLRHDSETKALTWADVDWGEPGSPDKPPQLRVRSKKTEGHEGCGIRHVPIVPWLMDLLLEAFNLAEPGQTFILSKGCRSTLNRRVEDAIEKAHITPWPALWQTLRSSCETDWEPIFGGAATARLVGHSQRVQRFSYTQIIPKEVYAKAANLDLYPERNPEQKVPGSEGAIRKPELGPTGADDATSGVCRDLQESSVSPDISDTWRRGGSNP
jgi:integrase